jgi:Mce-associated membrane protein
VTRLPSGTTTDEDAPSTTEDGPGLPEDHGTKSADGDGTGTADGGGAAGDGGGRRSATAWRRGALAVAVAVLLIGGGAFLHSAHQLRSTPSARNQALTDTEATTRVGGDVAEGLARIFSYAPAGADAAERSARTVLAGRAARQYEDLFAQVRASLAEQRITLTTQAVRTGVMELDGDSARLLVFLDQTSRRGKAAATSAAAQLTVTAKFQGDRWLIVDIKAR